MPKPPNDKTIPGLVPFFLSKLRLIFLCAMLGHPYGKKLGLYIGGRGANAQYISCKMAAPEGTDLLNSFDRRVYEALGALVPNSAPITSRQIHFLTGGTTEPSRAQKEAILGSIQKMTTITVSVRPASKTRTPKWLPDAIQFPLLIADILPPLQNDGFLRDSTIIQVDETPLETLIQKSGQITKVPVEWRQTNLRQSERRMALQDALLYELIRGRHENKSMIKISLSSLFEDIGLSTESVRSAGVKLLKTARNARALLRKDIPILLAELREAGVIRQFDLWPEHARPSTHVRIWLMDG